VLGDIEIAQSLQDKINKGAKTESSGVIDNPYDINYRTLKCDLTPVLPGSEMFTIIDTYVKQTKGRQVQLLDAWESNRHGEGDRFDAHQHIEHRKLLWHGTNVAVVAAILASGLRIMPHSGGRVGRGIYLASENGKSAGYGNKIFLFRFLFFSSVFSVVVFFFFLIWRLRGPVCLRLLPSSFFLLPSSFFLLPSLLLLLLSLSFNSWDQWQHWNHVLG